MDVPRIRLHSELVATCFLLLICASAQTNASKPSIVKTITGNVTEIDHPKAGTNVVVQGVDGITYQYGIEEGEVVGATANTLKVGDRVRVEFSNITRNYPPTYGNPVRTVVLRNAVSATKSVDGTKSDAGGSSLEEKSAASGSRTITCTDAESCTKDGVASFSRGSFREAFASWDKAIELGGVTTFSVCRDRAQECDPGILSLSTSAIYLTDSTGNGIFHVLPTHVGVSPVQQHHGVPTPFVPIHIATMEYDLDVAPLGVRCSNQPFLQCPPQAINQQRALATYIAYKLQKLAQSASAVNEPPRGAALAKQPFEHPPSNGATRDDTVLALLQTSGGADVLILPFMQITKGNYTPLPYGSTMKSVEQTQKSDFLPSGEPNLKSPHLVEAIRQSPLRKGISLDTYRAGKNIGACEVAAVDASYVDTPNLHIVGHCRAATAQPASDDMAAIGNISHSGLWPDIQLTSSQKMSLKNEAVALWPKTVPKNLATPTLVGKSLKPTNVTEKLALLDLNKNGEVQAFIKLSATMSVGASKTIHAEASLLASYDNARKAWLPIMKCSYVGDSESIAGDKTCSLIDVFEIKSDAAPKLLLLEGSGEVGDLVLYEFRDKQLKVVIKIEGWTGS